MQKRDQCRFACQADSDVLSNTAGSKLKPAVLAWASLSARATSRQYWLEHHCRLVSQADNVCLSIIVGLSRADSVGSTDTAGWCQDSIVLPTHYCRFWVPAMMWTSYHCRYATVKKDFKPTGVVWTPPTSNDPCELELYCNSICICV